MVHGQAIATGDQPTTGSAHVGELAVDAFFVLSGFLVTRSFLTGHGTGRYLWHRFLRIMPGFWVCLLVTAFVAAPLIAALEGEGWAVVLTGDRSAVDYVLNNSALLMRQFDVAGLPDRGHSPGVLDGALWTLFYEALCYLVVAALGAAGLLRHRPGAVVLLTAALWALTLAAAAGAAVPGEERPVRFTFVFLLGALGYLYRDRVPVHPALALGALAVLGAGLFATDDYRLFAAPAFAYLLLWAMVRLPLTWDPGVDLSYGVYVYHWPVLQVLVSAGLTGSLLVHGLLGAVLIPLVAALSWYCVEKPALSLKSLGRATPPAPFPLDAVTPHAIPLPRLPG